MIKKLFLGLILLALVALTAIYFFGSALLNQGVKSGIETFGPRVTQTPVTLESANLSILSGSGSLRNLLVGNPDGFKSENIFALGQIDIKVDRGSVFSDKVIIDHVIIQSPQISFEQSARGSNLRRLMNNIEAFTGPKEEETPPAEAATGAQKQVVIRKLIIEDGSIYVGAMGIGQTVPLPRIEMANIGESGERLTTAEAIDLVLGRILQAIGPAISNVGGRLLEGGQSALDSTAGEASRRITDAAGDTVNRASESIRGIFGN